MFENNQIKNYISKNVYYQNSLFSVILNNKNIPPRSNKTQFNNNFLNKISSPSQVLQNFINEINNTEKTVRVLHKTF